jgi:hypothetical protein
MKRISIALLLILACMVSSVGYADSAVQQDQNYGYLKLATSSFTISSTTASIILTTAPSSSTVFLAQYPGGQWILLPARTRGFTITAFGGDMIIGEPDTMSIAAKYVGTKIASGTTFKWESLSPDQRTIKFKIMMHGTADGTATFCAWGQ